MFKKLLYAVILVLYAACQNIGNFQDEQSQFQSTDVVNLITATSVVETQVPLIKPSTETLTPRPSNPTTYDGMKLKLVFISQGQVWLWSQEGRTALAKVSKNGVVRLSSDGNVVAFATYSVEHPEFFAYGFTLLKKQRQSCY